MRIDIQTKELKLGQTFKQALKVKIRKLFQRNGADIRQINITFKDVNGPKGGDDKLCKVNVFVKGQHILVSARESTAYKAAASAIKKANAALNKRFDKSKNPKHISISNMVMEESLLTH